MIGNLLAQRYRIVRQLGKGWTSSVYLAYDTRERDNPVAIKVLKSNTVSRRIEDIIRFRSEACTVSTLTHPNIIKFLELGESDHFHYLVMEYFPAQSLSELMNNGCIIDFDQVVEIILQIGRALDYIHKRDVIHRDLKPGNILLSYTNSTIEYTNLKVIDFGLSQVKNLNEPGDEGELVGSFHYLAPEQTGLMRVKVDERSDLYSLGIIFYQLLTKQLPFTARHIGSLIHQHIAQPPPPPTALNRDIPPILEKIVLKLIAKAPEDRYQGAQGLLNDLEKVRRGRGDFEVGLEDMSLKLRYRTKLIGREQELEQLKSLFDAMLKGEGSICFIKGEPGIGKSRLAEELKEYSYQKARTHIGGKCFIGLNKVPYGPFKEALDSYIRTFMHYTKLEKEGIREELIESLGELGEIIVRLNPQMERIIGEFPPLVPLEPDRENQRFITVASQFFKTLSRLERGLVLSLDDLQWMDEASFELLTYIAQDIGRYPLLIIGTYRDNEITSGHSLLRFQEDAAHHHYPLTEIGLEPFDGERMEQFTARLLHTNEKSIASISRFLLQRSRGNPFFALEILKQLINEEAVYYRENRWKIDSHTLSTIEIFSTIVDTLLKRISLLDEIEVRVLSYAAVVGRKFDIDLLFELSEEIKGPGLVSHKRIVEVVEKAKDLQLLEEDFQERGKILFVHDRIREAFYLKIGEERRRLLHNRIGLVLESLYKEKGSDILFELVYHFVEGENREKSLWYAYPAGMKAKEEFGNEEAIRYLSMAKSLLEECGRKHTEQWIRCVQALGEVYLLVGRNDDAIVLYEQILPHVNEDMAKARLLMQISQACFKKWDYHNCELYAKRGLALLNERLPLKRGEVIVSLIKEFLVHLFHEIFLKWFYRFHKRKESEKYGLIVWFYYSLCWSYIFIDPVKCMRGVLRALNLSASKIGPSRELGMLSSGYAVIMMSIPLFKRAKIYLDRALKNNREVNSPWAVGQALEFFGYYHEWKGEYKRAIDYLTQGLEIMRSIGDIKESSIIVDHLRNNHRYLGEYKKAIYYNSFYNELAAKAEDKFGIIDSQIAYAILYHELGEYEKAEEWLSRVKTLPLEERFNFSNFEKNAYLGLIALEKDEVEKSLHYLETACGILGKNFLLKQYTIYIYTSITEAHVKEYETERRNHDPSINRPLLRKIKKVCRLARKKTKRWVTHRGGALRVNAEYYSLIGKDRKAEAYFLESIRLSESIGIKYELALGYYEYGHFLNKRNRKEQAVRNWRKASILFQEMGASGWIKKLEPVLGFGETAMSPLQRFVQSFKGKKTTTQLAQLGEDIVSAIDIDELLDKVLEGVLEITCAQRGYLLLKDEESDELDLLASKSIDRTTPSFEELSLGVANDVFQSGETAVIANARTDEKYSHNQSIIQYGIKSILCFPIVYQKTTKGVCYLDNLLSGSVFTEENIEQLNRIIAHALLAYENTLLRKSNKRVRIDEERLNILCEESNLTHREKEILSFVLKGFTNREISKKLYISHSTVHAHLNKIYQKTKAGCREELIRFFTG